MKLAIVGSRGFNDYEKLKNVIEYIGKENDKIELIISGGARGADSLGERYANENGIETLIFTADWNKYGNRAGVLRNVDIIKNCDICVAFWDLESHGTKHDIELCIRYNKPCYVYNYLKKELFVDEKLIKDNVKYIQ